MQSSHAVPDELRCTYRSKPCPHERARKRNGTFHKLCQEHRLRANENQRNMQRRLRERRRRMESKHGAADVAAAVAAAAGTTTTSGSGGGGGGGGSDGGGGDSDGRGSDASGARVENARQDEYAPLDEDEDVDEWGLYAIEPLAQPAGLRAEDLEALELFWEKKDAPPA